MNLSPCWAPALDDDEHLAEKGKEDHQPCGSAQPLFIFDGERDQHQGPDLDDSEGYGKHGIGYLREPRVQLSPREDQETVKSRTDDGDIREDSRPLHQARVIDELQQIQQEKP